MKGTKVRVLVSDGSSKTFRSLLSIGEQNIVEFKPPPFHFQGRTIGIAIFNARKRRRKVRRKPPLIGKQGRRRPRKNSKTTSKPIHLDCPDTCSRLKGLVYASLVRVLTSVPITHTLHAQGHGNTCCCSDLMRAISPPRPVESPFFADFPPSCFFFIDRAEGPCIFSPPALLN